ncbi:MAG: hypothetical protein RLZZ301_245 [Bacteroidota bacterium]|jgi:hypothetical protein
MKQLVKKPFLSLTILFGALSLFASYNVLNWDILGWGSTLFLFPFLCAISALPLLIRQATPYFRWAIIGSLVLHVVLYSLLFKKDNPETVNLMLILAPLQVALSALFIELCFHYIKGFLKWLLSLLSLLVLGLQVFALFHQDLGFVLFSFVGFSILICSYLVLRFLRS